MTSEVRGKLRQPWVRRWHRKPPGGTTQHGGQRAAPRAECDHRGASVQGAQEASGVMVASNERQGGGKGAVAAGRGVRLGGDGQAGTSTDRKARRGARGAVGVGQHRTQQTTCHIHASTRKTAARPAGCVCLPSYVSSNEAAHTRLRPSRVPRSGYVAHASRSAAPGAPIQASTVAAAASTQSPQRRDRRSGRAAHSRHSEAPGPPVRAATEAVAASTRMPQRHDRLSRAAHARHSAASGAPVRATTNAAAAATRRPQRRVSRSRVAHVRRRAVDLPGDPASTRIRSQCRSRRLPTLSPLVATAVEVAAVTIR